MFKFSQVKHPFGQELHSKLAEESFYFNYEYYPV